MLESPFIKVAGFAGSATLLKKDSSAGISCGISETFKNIYFVEHLQNNGCFWFLEAFNLDMLQDKRRRFIRIFLKDETTEFAKLRAFRAYAPYVPTCLRTSNYYVATCLKLLRALHASTCL